MEKPLKEARLRKNECMSDKVEKDMSKSTETVTRKEGKNVVWRG